MTTSLVVPWRPAPHRVRQWEFCRDWWASQQYLDEIIECDSGHDPFTRGCSINEGVAKSQSEFVIIADADVLASNVWEALYHVRESERWVIAHGPFRYYCLEEEESTAALEGKYELLASDPATWMERGNCLSGVLVMRREVFLDGGGFDERFRGWGPEDAAFAEQMDTLVGPHLRVDGFTVQLYHERINSERWGNPSWTANNELAKSYFAARHDPAAMRALVSEWREPS